jgi:LDH2 family malate/lactate/ureidoglycolate dehydrogenase
VQVTLIEVRRFLRDAFVALGAPDDDADLVADVLTTADRFGIETHGVQRLGYYVERVRNGVTLPAARSEVIRETIAADAMARAITKAKRLGLGAVAVRNSTHYGIAGYYALQAANAGCIGVTTTNARPCIAPTYGVTPTYGTNPLAFAAPSAGEDPFLFDGALSIIQRGNVEVAARDGRPIAEGLAIDNVASPATDPAALLRDFEHGEAALLPLGGAGKAGGGHKGFGLAMIMEILNSALQDGAFLTDLGGADRKDGWAPYRTGHFFLAIDPAGFLGEAVCRRVVAGIQETLRALPPAPGRAAVLVAGDPEWQAAAIRDRDGVELPKDLTRELTGLASELGIRALD